MKALSVRQPHAWLLVMGWKDVENRSWATTHRGHLLIHASKAAMTKADWQWLRTTCDDLDIPTPDPAELPCGGVVGAINLVGCASSSPSPWWDGESIAWLISESIDLVFVPCAGALKIFDIPDFDTSEIPFQPQLHECESEI